MSTAQAPVRVPFSAVADRGNLIEKTMGYKPNNTSTIDLQRTGYMAALSGVATFTFTTIAGTVGTVKPSTGIPAPYSAFKRIRLYSNQQTSYVDVDMFGLFLWNLVQDQQDMRNLRTSFDAADNGARIYNVPQSLAASTTYQVTFPIRLRPQLGDKDLLSLILLEGRGTMYVDLQFNDVTTALYNFSAGGIDPASVTFAFTPEIDTFMVPTDPTITPDLSPVKILRQYNDPFVAAGTDKFFPTNGGTELRLLMYYLDNNGNRVSTQYMRNYRLKFGGIITPEAGSVQNLVYTNCRDLGFALPTGVICFDFMRGAGNSSLLPSLRDSIRLRDAQDLVVEVDFDPATPNMGAAGQRIVIVEELRDVSAH